MCQSNAGSGGCIHVGLLISHKPKFAQHVPNIFHLNPNLVQFPHNVAITHLIIELARIERSVIRTSVSCQIL